MRPIRLICQPLGFQRILCRSHRFGLLILTAIGSVTLQRPGLAQVTPDATLTNPSIVTTGAINRITGGTTSGNTLFHSFDRFSVKLGDVAWFDNATTIQNIITRVTGTSGSQIDGQIRANGNANLFLINPNGISFGSSAQLSIGGSFIGSTARSVKFADGSEFSAIVPQSAPLLIVNLPVGLQYGATPAPISVQGVGHKLTVNTSNFSVTRTARPPGLRVNPGQTLALVGGDVNLSGGNLTAENGRIELGAVRESGLVKLTSTNPGWTLGYSGVQTFGDIRLTQASSVDTSGNGGGEIRSQGRNISLVDGSTFLATTLGSGQGRGISVKATESLELLGFSGDSSALRFVSSLFTDASIAATSKAQGGDIMIETGLLRVTEGAQVSASTLAAGNAGNLTVKAQTIELQGGVLPFGGGGLFATVLNRTSRGQGGSVQVEAEQLTIRDGAKISVSTVGIGNAGQLNVQANAIDIAGRSASFGSSGIFARGATGNGGDLTVKSDRLRVADGAQITVSTSSNGTGNAGTLSVEVKTIDLIGIGVGAPSGLFASVLSRASGKGGDLKITADRLTVQGGAQVVVATSGSGKAGDLSVNAREVILSGTSPQSRSGLFASAVVDTGNGGDINVVTQRLTIQEGATISVSNFGSTAATPPGRGAAGNILINANAIDLKNGTIGASTLAGASGNIEVQSSTLVMQRNAMISTNSKGNESGGNIKINSEVLVGVGNSDITANAVNARGGQVSITADSILGLMGRDRLTPENDITATSDLGISFNGNVEIKDANLNPTNGITELPDQLSGQQITQQCNEIRGSSFIITGRGGIPHNPIFKSFRDNRAWQDIRDLSGPTPIAQTATPAGTIVEMTSLQRNSDGSLELTTPIAATTLATAETCSS